MNLELFKPTSDILKQYINNYYILRKDDNKKTTYLTFPNPNSIVSVLDKAELCHSPNVMDVKYNPEAPLVSDVTLSYKNPILIRYNGLVKEISICFKPLGLNAFMSNSTEIANEKRPFFPYGDYKESMQEIIRLTDSHFLIEELERYLLSKLKPFDHPFLPQFVDDINNTTDTSLRELAKKYGVSQKTLIKHVKVHLNRTPSEFMRVVRFHNAIKTYFSTQEGLLSLTELGHAVSFFDQAHMIKDFKSLTGYTPRSFFQTLVPTNGELNWIFL